MLEFFAVMCAELTRLTSHAGAVACPHTPSPINHGLYLASNRGYGATWDEPVGKVSSVSLMSPNTGPMSLVTAFDFLTLHVIDQGTARLETTPGIN